MADYWKKRMDELDEKLKKEAQKKKTLTAPSASTVKRNISGPSKLRDERDITPVMKTFEPKKTTVTAPERKSTAIAKAILGTAGDLGMNAASGAVGHIEGITDSVGYGAADIADKIGKGSLADRIREKTKESFTQKLFGDAIKTYGEHSLSGDFTDSVAQGIGQVGTSILGGALLGGAGLAKGAVSAITTGTTAMSGFGSGVGQAYEGGATDEEAKKYGMIAGASEALTEILFGGLGKVSKALGHSKGLLSLDDILAKKVSNIFSNQIVKNMAEFGVKSSAEGFEEVLAGIAQAVGKKITYMKDEDLKKILKDEKLLEQYLVGMTTSAIMQSGDFISSAASKTDFITGLDQNEQKVVDKAVENRIAEAEKDGKKLSKKDKDKIYDEVRKALDEGDIDTDIIESTLGGEKYESYKNLKDKSDTFRDKVNKANSQLQEKYDELQKEHDSLNSNNLEEASRQSDIKQEQAKIKEQFEKNKGLLKELDADTSLDELKTKLGENVSDLVKDSRLAESYNEKARRKEAFKADLSKYDAKQQEVIKKAVESGILNNTRKTHSFVDFIAKISANKGVSFDFTSNEKLKESGFAIEGRTVNGLVTKDGIQINVNSAKALNTVVGHEVMHIFEGTELYPEIQRIVKEVAVKKGEYQSRYDEITELYEDIEDADIDAELTADLVGDYLFSDEDFIRRLSTENRSLFDKLRDEIKYLCKVATAGSAEARKLEQAKKLFEKVYREAEAKINTADEGGVRYSFSGTKSKTYDFAALEKAIRLEDVGKATSEEIRQQTGWFRGYDGKWRYEISDRDMEIDTTGKFSSNPDIRRYAELFDKAFVDMNATEAEWEELRILEKNLTGVSKAPKTLGDLIRHDKLFAAYPQLKDIDVHFADIDERGAYNPVFKEITLNKKLKPEKSKLTKTLIHEIQHAIQDIEGFAGGSNTEYWRDMGIPEDKLRDYYENTAGEIEARDAAMREWRTDEARKETRPDIDRTDVVFSDGGVYKMSAEKAKYDPEIAGIREQIGNSKSILNEMSVIGEANAPQTLKTKYEAAQWAISQLKSFGYQVDRQNFGRIYFNEKDIRNGAEYADTSAEKAAFILIPKVLKRGIEIGHHGDHKLRQKETVTFAGPVILNGIRGNMAVVVNMNGNKYMVHRIVLPDGTVFKFNDKNNEVKQESYQGVTKNGSLADTTSFTSNNSIPNSTENVKQKGVFSLSSQNTVPKKYGNYNVYGEDVMLEGKVKSAEDPPSAEISAPTAKKEITAPTRESIAEGKKKAITGAPMSADVKPLKNEQVAEKETVEPVEAVPVKTMKDKLSDRIEKQKEEISKKQTAIEESNAEFDRRITETQEKNSKRHRKFETEKREKIEHLQEERSRSEKMLEKVKVHYDELISQSQAEYAGKKNKNTKEADKILRRIERQKRLKADAVSEWSRKIRGIDSKIYDYEEQITKNLELTNQAKEKQTQKLYEQKLKAEAEISERINEIESGITRLENMKSSYDESLTKDQLSRLEKYQRKALTRFEADKKALDEEYAEKKASLQEEVKNESAYISRKARELYDEIVNHKKGVRFSKEVGYFLDSGYKFKDIKSTLLKVSNWPDMVLNPESKIEEDVRKEIGATFVSKNEELKMLDTKLAEEKQKLEEDADKAFEKFERANRRMTKQKELEEQMAELIGDTSTWKDKKYGLQYKVNTLKRNLREVVRDADGKRDIAKADRIYYELQGKYNHNEAELFREANKFKAKYEKMEITKAEDKYIQMLGELGQNPDTTLTVEAVEEYYEEHKKQINNDKVQEVIKEARKDYDDLLVRVNKVLKEHGMQEIPHRKGYFPHFTEEKQGILGKLFNWKTQNNDVPTDIAGMTESFNPTRSWQSFNKQRTGDNTVYSFMKGFDTYVQGALDWIYHIEDLQKRRAFENHIRYIHSEEGIKEQIEAIKNNEEYDADTAQKQIELVYANAKNPLNNFVTNFRTATNTLAGKKSSMDRGMEEDTNRRIYSTMTNISNRVSGNLIAGSISSAFTNFIPITLSWGQVSPISTLKAMKQTIASTHRDDGTINKSDFLTTRLRAPENLYKTAWDKIGSKVGWLMESIDSFTSQTVWRSKYIENIAKGMSENEAIKNADQFSANVMASRSRGDLPTIFDSKNPLVKVVTAFQVEVSNQYGYMLKDMPQDMAEETKAKLVKGYLTMFVGAYAFNALYSKFVGRDAAFDPIGIIEDVLKDLGVIGDDWMPVEILEALGLLDEDDEEEETDVADVFDAVGNFAKNVTEEIPYVGGLLGGGRIPISSALPYDGHISEFWESTKGVAAELNFDEGMSEFWTSAKEAVKSKNFKSLTRELLNPVYYLAMPMGGGQLRKTIQGLKMFDDDLPIAGSYTDSGKLRFPVDKTPLNVAQAAVFGQYANKNAREYFDEGYAPLNEKQTKEFKDLDLPIADYRKIKEGQSNLKPEEGKKTVSIDQKAEYINSLDLPINKKHVLKSYLYDEEEYKKDNPKKYAFLEKEGIGYIGYKELDEETQQSWSWAFKHQDEYRHLKENGVYPEDYSVYQVPMLDFDDEENKAYEWAFDYPEKASFGSVFNDGVKEYRKYTSKLYEIRADKDRKGKSISGSAKRKKKAYIWSLDIDEGAKYILFRNEYKSDDTYNGAIINYLLSRNDISYEDKKTILTELDFKIDSKGRITWN